MHGIAKYPRTRHIQGSGLQKGDYDLKVAPFSEIAGKPLIVEEKVDGANTGISFDQNGSLRLQCRGHYLDGGAGEAQFNLLKPWAETHRSWLWKTLGSRYILYGEWLYAKHTVYYDALPHYFMEFDILDTENGDFLSTDSRHEMLSGKPIVSVPVLYQGVIRTVKPLDFLVAASLYKTTNWRNRLWEAAVAAGSDPEIVTTRETDGSDKSEGLYLKWEQNGVVVGRYKWVRRDFINAILDSGSHFRDRPIIPNGLREDIDLFAL